MSHSSAVRHIRCQVCCSWQLSALRKCTVRLSLELEVDREIILDCWHHAAYEFQEDEKGLSHLRFTAVRLYSINNCLHNLGVVAWMNTRLLHVNMRVLLHGHGLLGIVGSDVLKYFSLSQRVAILVVACEPQPWRLRIEIVRYT